jgi:hypothetical protein
VDRTRVERLFNWIQSAITSFWMLPAIRYILRPFRQLDRVISGRLAKSQFQGWRMGLLIGCCVSTTVLCINLTMFAFISTQGKGFQNGVAIPWHGTAEDMSRRSSAMHVVINALSTVLLGASNYTMQVLSSPTRKDIAKAHARSQYLDIGFLSTRNLSRIPRRRLVLFLIMGVSSIPIHLL